MDHEWDDAEAFLVESRLFQLLWHSERTGQDRTVVAGGQKRDSFRFPISHRNRHKQFMIPAPFPPRCPRMYVVCATQRSALCTTCSIIESLVTCKHNNGWPSRNVVQTTNGVTGPPEILIDQPTKWDRQAIQGSPRNSDNPGTNWPGNSREEVSNRKGQRLID